MKGDFLDQGVIELKQEAYFNLLIILAPILNFLSSLTLTLYTASLPAISRYFDSSMMIVKNMVAFSMIGFAVGCIIFGTALDTLGRRRVILFALAVYIIASLAALIANHIGVLIFICFIQGMMSSTVSIGPRALVSDNFTGHRFQIGLLYTSIAYGLGSIIGPFIGGMLQYHFGWQANFLAYTLFAAILLFIVALYVNESLPVKPAFSLKKVVQQHFTVLKHKHFVAGIILGGACQFELMVYPAIGAFIVENILHQNALVYGNSALVISAGYLIGTLTNRILIKKFHLHHLSCLGVGLLVLGLALQLGFGLAGVFNLVTLALPITIIGFANGLFYVNVLGTSLKLFPQNAGIAMAVFTCLLMAIAALAIFLISHIAVTHLLTLALFFAVPIVIQCLVYLGLFKHALRQA